MHAKADQTRMNAQGIHSSIITFRLINKFVERKHVADMKQDLDARLVGNGSIA